MTSYRRITHELRAEWIERATAEGIEMHSASYEKARELAYDFAKVPGHDPLDPEETRARYARGFARAFCGLQGGDGLAGMDEMLGVANGFNTRRMLEGKLPATLPDGRPR